MSENKIKITQRCDYCGNPAVVDGKTKYGPWAFMCPNHWNMYGIPIKGYYSYLDPSKNYPFTDDQFNLIAIAFGLSDEKDPVRIQLKEHLKNNKDALVQATKLAKSEWSKCAPLPADTRGNEVYWLRLKSLDELLNKLS